MFGNWFKKKPKRVYVPPAKAHLSAQAKATAIKAKPYSEKVLREIRRQVAGLIDVPKDEQTFISDEMIAAMQEGGNMHRMCWALEEIGISRERVVEIAQGIHGSAKSLENIERQREAGVLEADWAHSGGKCFVRFPDDKEGEAKNALHQAANGKRFNITKGLLIDGRWTFPGVEWGCKCTSRTILKGFND
ncbi:hypothetical protein [Komagataeibacter europaeus]|uniref:hypothetical protein n=1 Tax=Komagataeibacter europaeus TaxID=33995 RepID=UPI0015F8D241|nr:hypothetical protein [Komagataeibacter europaeus]